MKLDGDPLGIMIEQCNLSGPDTAFVQAPPLPPFPTHPNRIALLLPHPSSPRAAHLSDTPHRVPCTDQFRVFMMGRDFGNVEFLERSKLVRERGGTELRVERAGGQERVSESYEN